MAEIVYTAYRDEPDQLADVDREIRRNIPDWLTLDLESNAAVSKKRRK